LTGERREGGRIGEDAFAGSGMMVWYGRESKKGKEDKKGKNANTVVTVCAFPCKKQRTTAHLTCGNK